MVNISNFLTLSVTVQNTIFKLKNVIQTLLMGLTLKKSSVQRLILCFKCVLVLNTKKNCSMLRVVTDDNSYHPSPIPAANPMLIIAIFETSRALS